MITGDNMVHSDDDSGKEFSKSSKEKIAEGHDSISYSLVKKKYPWPVTNIILSSLCILWLIENHVGLTLNLDWVAYIMVIPGSILALVTAVSFFVKAINRNFSGSFLLLALKIFLLLMPLFLTWSPAPYGIIPTLKSYRADVNVGVVNSISAPPEDKQIGA